MKKPLALSPFSLLAPNARRAPPPTRPVHIHPSPTWPRPRDHYAIPVRHHCLPTLNTCSRLPSSREDWPACFVSYYSCLLPPPPPPNLYLPTRSNNNRASSSSSSFSSAILLARFVQLGQFSVVPKGSGNKTRGHNRLAPGSCSLASRAHAHLQQTPTYHRSESYSQVFSNRRLYLVISGHLGPPTTNLNMNAPISSPTHQQAQSSTNWPQAQSNGFGAVAPPKPPLAKTPSTDPFLKDFTLVAEAAKRAQMAVMIRDLENVGLS